VSITKKKGQETFFFFIKRQSNMNLKLFLKSTKLKPYKKEVKYSFLKQQLKNELSFKKNNNKEIL